MMKITHEARSVADTLKLNVDVRTRMIVKHDGEMWQIEHERLDPSGAHWIRMGRITTHATDHVHIMADADDLSNVRDW